MQAQAAALTFRLALLVAVLIISYPLYIWLLFMFCFKIVNSLVVQSFYKWDQHEKHHDADDTDYNAENHLLKYHTKAHSNAKQ